MTEKEFEAGFREWSRPKSGLLGLGEAARLAAAYYASLKDEGMSVEEIEAWLATKSQLDWVEFARKGSGPESGYYMLAKLIQPLTVPQPRPVESVEGGLTWDEHDMRDCVTDELFERLGGSWRKDIGTDIEVILDIVTQILSGKLVDLRAELADLKANSIPMPEWKDAPKWAKGIWCVFTSHTDNGDDPDTIAYIPRPVTERPMTPEEMAEAWKDWYGSDLGPGTDEGAEKALLAELLSGSTIQQLMQEAGLKTTRGV